MCIFRVGRSTVRMSIPLSQTVLCLLSISPRFWLTFILGPITPPLTHNLFVSQFCSSWDHNLNLYCYGNFKFHLLLKQFNLTALSLHTWLGIWTELVFVIIIIIMYAEYRVRQKNAWNILLLDAQHFHSVNTLLDTIRWLVTSTGQYVNIWGFRDYEHTPEKVINVNSTTIMWDIVVITDQTIQAN